MNVNHYENKEATPSSFVTNCHPQLLSIFYFTPLPTPISLFGAKEMETSTTKSKCSAAPDKSWLQEMPEITCIELQETAKLLPLYIYLAFVLIIILYFF